jgi:Concanavalin A-like lectin/glucanases superfamily
MHDRNARASTVPIASQQKFAAFGEVSRLRQTFSPCWLTVVCACTIAAALTSSAVAQQCIQPPNTTLVAWFPFDETSGTTTANLATQNSGTLGGTATFIPGLVGGALHFDGQDSWVDSPSSIVTNFGPGVVTGAPCAGPDSTCAGAFSIDVWIRVPTDLDDSVKTILDKRSGTDPNIHGYSFALSYSRLILQLADGLGAYGFTNYASIPITNLKDHNWHHVAVSVTRPIPNGIRWYHNGAALAGQEIDPTDREGSLINDSPIRLGANSTDPPFDNWFNGDMDELQIFNRALSGQEVLAIYNAGSAGQCKP